MVVLEEELTRTCRVTGKEENNGDVDVCLILSIYVKYY